MMMMMMMMMMMINDLPAAPTNDFAPVPHASYSILQIRHSKLGHYNNSQKWYLENANEYTLEYKLQK